MAVEAALSLLAVPLAITLTGDAPVTGVVVGRPLAGGDNHADGALQARPDPWPHSANYNGEATITATRGGISPEVTWQRQGWTLPHAFVDPASITSGPWSLFAGGRSVRVCTWGGDRRSPAYSLSLPPYRQTDVHDVTPLPGGRVLYATIRDQGSVWTLQSWIISNATGTPTELESRAMRLDPDDDLWGDPTTHSVRSVHVAALGSAVLLLVQIRDTTASGPADRIVQWASVDEGRSWELVGASPVDDSAHGVAAVEATGSKWVTAWANQALGSDNGSTLRISLTRSAFEPVWTSESTTLAAPDVDVAIWDDSNADQVRSLKVGIAAHEDGTLHLVAHSAACLRGISAISVDGGASWSWLPGRHLVGITAGVTAAVEGWPATWHRQDSEPNDLDCCAALGGVLVVWGTPDSPLTTTAWAAGTWAALLGGWSGGGPTPPHWPGIGVADRDLPGSPSRGPQHGWLCTDGEPRGDWTAVQSGSPSVSVPVGSAHLQITGSAGVRALAKWERETTRYLSPVGGDLTRRFAFRVEVRPGGARTSHSAPAFVDIYEPNAGFTNAAGIRVAIGTDGVSVYERTGALEANHSLITSVAFASPLGGRTAFWIWVEVDDATRASRVVVRYAPITSVLEPAAWVQATDTSWTATNVYGTMGSAPKLTFGGWCTSSEQTRWYACDMWDDLLVGRPALMPGRRLAGSLWTMLPTGEAIRSSGIVGAGDSWTMSRARQRPLSHLLTDDPLQAWDHGDVGEVVMTAELLTPYRGPLMALLVRGLRAGPTTIRVHDSIGNGWYTIDPGSDRVIDAGVSGAAGGGWLVPTGSSPLLLRDSEFAGWWVTVDGVAAQIVSHNGGMVDDQAATMVRFKLDRVLFEAGDIVFFAHDGLLVLEIPDPMAIDRVEVTIDAQSPSDWPTTWSAAMLRVCQVWALAQGPDWGSAVALEAPVIESTRGDGRRSARKQRPIERTVTLSWNSGVPTNGAAEITPAVEPPAVRHRVGGPGLAVIGQTPWQLTGLLRQAHEVGEEIVYVPRLQSDDLEADDAPGGAWVQRHDAMIHGRIVSPVSLESLVGEEQVSEVLIVPQLVIQEIV